MTTIKNIKLYKDLGFNSDYNHVIDFDNATAQSNYFSNQVHTIIESANFNKPQNILKLAIAYDSAIEYTYCSFLMGTKTFYYWVKSVELVNDTTSALTLELDPFQTFMFNYTLGEGFVKRQHKDRWQKIQITPSINLKTPIIYFDNKESVQTVYKEVEEIKLPMYQDSTTTISTGEVKGITNILYFYFAYYDTNSDNTIQWYIVPFSEDGSPLYYEYDSTNEIFKRYPNKGMLLQNEIWSIWGLDPQKVVASFVSTFCIGKDYIEEVDSYAIRFKTHNFYVEKVEGVKIFYEKVEKQVTELLVPYTYAILKLSDYLFGEDLLAGRIPDWILKMFTKQYELQSEIYASAPNDGDDYSDIHEPALFTAPYIKQEILDQYGNVILENPFIVPASNNIRINHRLTLELDSNYEILELTNGVTDDIKKLCRNSSMGLSANLNVKNMPIISDPWLSYCLNQRIADKNLISANAIIQGVSGAVSLGATGLALGGLMAAGGGISGGLATALGLSAGISTISSTVTNIASSFEEQKAKETKIHNEPSTTLAQSTGAYGLLVSTLPYELKFVTLRCDFATYLRIAKSLMKYGYTSQDYVVPNTKTRKFFNFIQVDYVEIKGNIPQDIKAQIEMIYKSGVTIWHGDNINSLTGIGDYSKENIERSLLT